VSPGRRSCGPVQIRLSGEPADISAAIAALAAVSEVLTHRGPYPNRRDAGVRVYLTIRPAPAEMAGARDRA
jgi:hypothetical protein